MIVETVDARIDESCGRVGADDNWQTIAANCYEPRGERDATKPAETALDAMGKKISGFVAKEVGTLSDARCKELVKELGDELATGKLDVAKLQKAMEQNVKLDTTCVNALQKFCQNLRKELSLDIEIEFAHATDKTSKVIGITLTDNEPPVTKLLLPRQGTPASVVERGFVGPMPKPVTTQEMNQFFRKFRAGD